MMDLSGILLQRLYYICAPTFNSQARMMLFMGQGSPQETENTWNKMAENLLGGEWEKIFEIYPVLARRIGTAIEYYLSFMEEFLDRFYDTKEILEKNFFHGVPINKIEKIQGEISDLHQEGKSVLILTFNGERKLVYKPRSLEIDVAWEEFVKHFTTGESSIRAPYAIDFGNYGFIEYIQHDQCKSESELETYYYNAGALMALLFAFGGNDFHMENIIASGTIPVIIDTETLMIPIARYFGKGGKDDTEEAAREDSLEDTIENHVLKMGLLPLWQKDGENKRADYGGITGDKEDMKNLPIHNGRKYPGNEFAAEICHGFRDMYQQIIKRREELLYGEKGLILFERCKFRMLIRNSQAYGNLLQHITQPALLKDGFDYSMKTDRLVNAFLYDAHESIISQLLNVFKSEKRAVERGDIPIFYGEPNREGILDEEGLLFNKYFEKSAIENAKNRILKLNEADMVIQLQIIEKSLATEVRNVHEYTVDIENNGKETSSLQELLSKEKLLDEAKEIYEEIMANRLNSKIRGYSWLIG